MYNYVSTLDFMIDTHVIQMCLHQARFLLIFTVTLMMEEEPLVEKVGTFLSRKLLTDVD